MLSIENKSIAIVQSLIELGADIEAKDVNERTPLMYACKVGSKEIVEILFLSKVNIDARTSLNDTAMTIAQKAGHHEV